MVEEGDAKKEVEEPKAQRLPGMEDPAIEILEALATKYKSAQRKRMAALATEVEVKNLILGEMHKRKKTRYCRGGLTITIKPKSELVQVTFEDEEND